MLRKKVMFLLGFIVLSMFLFIQPIKAETEIVPVYPEEDVSISGMWDEDGIFLSYHNYWESNLYLGGSLYSGGELRTKSITFLKFNMPNKTLGENEFITSMKVRLTQTAYRNYAWLIKTELVENNWVSENMTWDNQPESIGSSIIYSNFTFGIAGSNQYIELINFIDDIENGTMSIKIECFYNEDDDALFYSEERGEDFEKPVLIMKYEDISPPTPFTLTSNAGNPDRDGRFILNWMESEFANSYSVYQNDTLIESGLRTNIYLMNVSTNGYYAFKIVAFNEYRNISSNEIIINVEIQDIPPSSFILTSYADNPDTDGAFSLQWTTSEYAEDYSLYMNDTLIHSGINVSDYYIDNYLDGSYVFKIISFNYYGNTSSNEITVNIEIPPEPKPYPDADYFYADLDQYYASFVAYDADEYDFFNASVWSDNIITGYIMDKSNYNQFVNEGMFQPSSNIDYVNFGIANRWHTFTPTHADTWYFVFINAFAEHSHLDAYIYFHEDYFTEPELEPEPEPESNDFIIPSIIGFGALGLVVVVGIGEFFRIRKS